MGPPACCCHLLHCTAQDITLVDSHLLYHPFPNCASAHYQPALHAKLGMYMLITDAEKKTCDWMGVESMWPQWGCVGGRLLLTGVSTCFNASWGVGGWGEAKQTDRHEASESLFARNSARFLTAKIKVFYANKTPAEVFFQVAVWVVKHILQGSFTITRTQE